MLAFFFSCCQGGEIFLSCFCADFNTTYNMGTVASRCRFTAVGAAITLRVGLRWPNFPRWCSVMLPFYCCWCCYYTTGRAYAGQIFPVGVDVMLPFYCCWCCYYTTGRAYAGQIFPVGVDVMLPFYCCWCCYYTTARANAAKNFRRWCTRCVAVFTAVGAAIALRRG